MSKAKLLLEPRHYSHVAAREPVDALPIIPDAEKPRVLYLREQCLEEPCSASRNVLELVDHHPRERRLIRALPNVLRRSANHVIEVDLVVLGKLVLVLRVYVAKEAKER